MKNLNEKEIEVVGGALGAVLAFVAPSGVVRAAAKAAKEAEAAASE